MIFDTFDIEFLKLCGLCRYFPSGLQKVYDAPFIRKSVINNLQEHGIIKTMSDGKSYRLTRSGKSILADIGYDYPDDLRTDLNKTAYKRKLINAEINTMMYLAGIDVFFKYPSELSEQDGYSSALMMRSDKNMKVLSCSKFLGILRIGDTAYITYFVENEDSSIIPHFEKEIFDGQLSSIKNIKEKKLLIFGKYLDKLWEYISVECNGITSVRGRERFKEALEEVGMEYLLVPFSNGGVTQLTVLKNSRYRAVITDALGLENSDKKSFGECDGYRDGNPYIIGIDMNIDRILRALRQSERFDKSAIPVVCCLTFQKSVLERILKEKNAPKHKIAAIGKEGIKEAFPSRRIRRKGYITKGGNYIEVPDKNSKGI